MPDAPQLSPYETCTGQIDIYPSQPWIGKRKQLPFMLETIAADPQQAVTPSRHPLSVDVAPRISAWMQGALGLLLLYWLWWISWLNPGSPFFGHQAAVNRVQFNGTADQLVSASDDQSAIRWRANSFFRPLSNHQISVVDRTEKSIRVARYRPVDNNWLAMGLENGEIRLNNLLADDESYLFIHEKDDRVLDLVFSDDSRSLFSGHGSGWVLQWNPLYRKPASNFIEGGAQNYSIPQAQTKMDFAVYGLALVDDTTLCQFHNRLRLWNWQSGAQQSLAYPYDGSKDDYITSVSAAAYRPSLVATSDNQGHIILWNLTECLSTGGSCEIVDEWTTEVPVRAIALSNSGCYLASADASGRATLWPLSQNGRRAVEYRSGEVLIQSAQGLNSVDIKLAYQRILVASGGEDTRVRLKRYRQPSNLLCDSAQ